MKKLKALLAEYDQLAPEHKDVAAAVRKDYKKGILIVVPFAIILAVMPLFKGQPLSYTYFAFLAIILSLMPWMYRISVVNEIKVQKRKKEDAQQNKDV